MMYFFLNTLYFFYLILKYYNLTTSFLESNPAYKRQEIRIIIFVKSRKYSVILRMSTAAQVLFLYSGLVYSSSCTLPLLCDPSKNTIIHIDSTHVGNEVQCQDFCTTWHFVRGCNFYTFIPTALPGENNCHFLSECRNMGGGQPIGGRSGAWDCEDEQLFCPPIDKIPPVDRLNTVWTCEHGSHPFFRAQSV